jgi:bacteriocin-like protein
MSKGAKKPSKKDEKKKKTTEELSAEELKQVTGGAIDSFLKLGTLKGE